jgi:hypothetical protein
MKYLFYAGVFLLFNAFAALTPYLFDLQCETAKLGMWFYEHMSDYFSLYYVYLGVHALSMLLVYVLVTSLIIIWVWWKSKSFSSVASFLYLNFVCIFVIALTSLLMGTMSSPHCPGIPN